MYQDYSQFLQWMQHTIHAQENRIASLEHTIQKLLEEVKQLKDKPSINVEKIEYKFDQLKVENLDGTLNVGLNPSDLAGIEDFAVQNQPVNIPPSPKDQMQRSIKIEEALYRYLETDLPAIFEETQKRLNVQLDESYLSFIKQDIIKQLPTRIDYHLKSNANKERAGENQDAEVTILELLKKEIQNGIVVFINNLPDNVKGMKPQ
jgi:spore germination protein PC